MENILFRGGLPCLGIDNITRTGYLARTYEIKSTDFEAAKKKADRVKLRGQIRQQQEQEAQALLEQKERVKQLQHQELLEQQEQPIQIQKDGL